MSIFDNPVDLAQQVLAVQEALIRKVKVFGEKQPPLYGLGVIHVERDVPGRAPNGPEFPAACIAGCVGELV